MLHTIDPFEAYDIVNRLWNPFNQDRGDLGWEMTWDMVQPIYNTQEFMWLARTRVILYNVINGTFILTV
jgi:hypothetical protein